MLEETLGMGCYCSKEVRGTNILRSVRDTSGTKYHNSTGTAVDTTIVLIVVPAIVLFTLNIIIAVPYS